MTHKKSENIFTSIPQFENSETPPIIDSNEFVKVVESRRSVRVFKDEAIPEDIIKECLRMALLSPNSSNLQPWEFHWVRSAELKKQLAADCFSQQAAKTASDLIVCVARPSSWKKSQQEIIQEYQAQKNPPAAVMNYYQKLVPMVYGQGFLGIKGLMKKIIFSVVGLFRPVPRGPNSYSEMKLWATKTTALACQTLMLALRAHGYDSCPMEGFDEVRVKKTLGLGCGQSVVMILGCGRRAPGGIYGERIRSKDPRFVFRY